MLNFIGKWSLFSIYSIAVFLFIYFLNASYLFSIIKDWLLNNIEDGLTYDYIIGKVEKKYYDYYKLSIINYFYYSVGAGSAGIILAARLTDAGNHVLLLEAGGPAPYFADIPILAPLLQKSPYDWQHKTVPQVNACKGLINNQSTWPMGKIMGGSSRLNYMAYVKGHPNDYYQWFPDYKNYELNNNLITENPQWCSELCNTILTSIAEISQNNNNTNNYLIDFWKVNLTMTNGQRWSTDKLLNTKYRKQLMIIQYAYVDKIKFKLNKAEGVEFTKWNKRFSANAREAVIISAGAIGTPKLLMLSGIGPKNHLNDLKINVISNLPVGQNLMDHILTGIDLITLNKTLTLNLANVLSPKSALDYYLYGKGPWTSAGIEVVGTLQKNTKNNTYKPPDLQFMVIPVGVSQDNGIIIRKAMGISDKIFNDYFSTLAFKTAITIAPVLLHPQSHGEVKLRSSNPLDDVIIDPKYLSNEKDVALLLKGN